MKQRLANKKTKQETGLDYIISGMNLGTPFGTKAMKEKEPFFPGQEKALQQELEKVETMMVLADQAPQAIDILQETFMEMKDITQTIQRSSTATLTVVELYELKTFLLQTQKIRATFPETPNTTAPNPTLPQEFRPADLTPLLEILDPRGDRLNTFYLYDEFSPTLATLRKQKRDIELQIRREQKQKKTEIKTKYGIALTPKFELTVPKSNDETLRIIAEISDLERADEDYMSVTFTLKPTQAVYALTKEIEDIQEALEEEETKVRHQLSQQITHYQTVLLDNCRKIGELDITLSKALYAKAHQCVKPTIVQEHMVEFQEGRNLHVEDVLRAKGKTYCPISISLRDGVTCITGANMGGKTVSLKLIGMVAVLAQYAFFVPCKSATLGLSNYMQILIGDSQSVERGLSSFGSEMEELKEILDNSKDRSLLLIDEIASGTNPVEGQALTRSLIDYLKDKAYISLITTHFEAVTEDVRNMQVVGLADADFVKLDREIRYANRKERINIIAKYMNYSLQEVKDQKEIPKDALNIAKILGIDDIIIEKAKKYMK